MFGRRLLAERTAAGWALFDLGPDGKRRRATDVVVPDFVTEAEFDQYLADVFHESATALHPAVRRIED